MSIQAVLPAGWAAGEPVDDRRKWRGKGSGAVWKVNFNNGNANWNDTDNDTSVRLCRSAGE